MLIGTHLCSDPPGESAEGQWRRLRGESVVLPESLQSASISTQAMEQGTLIFKLYDLVKQSDEEVPWEVRRETLRNGLKSSTEVVGEASSKASSKTWGSSPVVRIGDRDRKTKSSTDGCETIVGRTWTGVCCFDSLEPSAVSPWAGDDLKDGAGASQPDRRVTA